MRKRERERKRARKRKKDRERIYYTIIEYNVIAIVRFFLFFLRLCFADDDDDDDDVYHTITDYITLWKLQRIAGRSS